MSFLEWVVLLMYVLTDICCGTLFLIVFDKYTSIWRKKTKEEFFALIVTGWLFFLYLAQIVVTLLGKM